MKLGIIGLEQSGKTTVFNALTGSDKEVGTYGRLEAHIAMVKVPDERLSWLTEFYKPKKETHADIEFMDIPGSINDSSDPKILATAHEVDALIFVIRAFKNPNVPHPHETVNPLRDYGYINMGLIVADMMIAEKRLEKLKATKHKITDKKEQKEAELEMSALEKIMAQFEAEEPASEADLTEEEKKIIRGFQLLTLKPCLTLLNVSEDELQAKGTEDLVTELPNCMAMCASIETEIEKLDEKDRKTFLDDLGIKELSINTLIKNAYRTLGLISFFTVGKDEVRAWTIPKGTLAPAAAGKVHTDLERGFIRAEVFSYEHLRSAGSEQEVRRAGNLRQEGKDYIVKDGDILFIKFSV